MEEQEDISRGIQSGGRAGGKAGNGERVDAGHGITGELFTGFLGQ